jgi:hypothetical protein
VLIYLDLCCLKRPFDDQSQSRVHLESEAVLGLLAIESDQVRFVRSSALLVENSLNPIRERASRVDRWLRAAPVWQPSDAKQLELRITELMRLGLKNFDASHVACAELVRADCFATCDDRLLTVAHRSGDQIRVPVKGIVELAQEVIK